MRLPLVAALPLAAATLVLTGCGEEAEKKRQEELKRLIADEVNLQVAAKVDQELSFRMRAAVQQGIQDYIAAERARQAEAAKAKAAAKTAPAQKKPATR
ncbi:MAG: hypothetical protein RLZZ127_2630 [Planctomycetota bacterium]|jgi:hypothetical protein